jgi:two-component system KDP operon response regulator KdpE
VNGARVLVVDDEPQILRAVQMKLRNAGYAVDTATTATDALSQATMRPPEAVILDLLLPDGSGTDVCRELRRWSSAPILVLSAVGEEKEKIAALDAGADDYVTKPFSGDELLARLRAALRRTAPPGEPVIEVGELRIDRDKRSVTMAGKAVSLTPTEWDLLRLLACLAAEHGSCITALAVIEVPSVLPLASHMLEEEADAKLLLRRAEAVGESYGVRMVGRIVRGREAGPAIAEEAAAREVELVVLGARRGRRKPFGRTVESVLKRSPCRVLVIAPPPVAAAARTAA